MKSMHYKYYIPANDNSHDVEEEVGRLMNTPDFDAFNAMNVAEALTEMDIKQYEDLQMCLDLRNFEMIGRKIWSITEEYLEKHARIQAEANLGNQ